MQPPFVSFFQKMVRPAAKREAVAHLRAVLGLSERRACGIVNADRTMIRCQSRRPPETELRTKIRDMANERKRFGYRRLFILLRQGGEPSGVNRIYRLYRDEGLSLRKRQARRRAVGTRAPILVEAKANARWSLDFVHDQFASGRRFRVLNIVNDVTRECLAAIPDTSISRRRVVRELVALIKRRGKPGLIVSDNGLVFTSRKYTALVRSYGLKLEFITPHCPQQNGMVERVIRTLKEQCIHRQRFDSLHHATRTISDWIAFYNHRRPHQALDMKTPPRHSHQRLNLCRSRWVDTSSQ